MVTPSSERQDDGPSDLQECGKAKFAEHGPAPVRWGLPARGRNTFTGYYARIVVVAFIDRLDWGYAYFGELPLHALG